MDTLATTGLTPPSHGPHYLAVWNSTNCDACLSLLAEAVIRQAVARLRWDSVIDLEAMREGTIAENRKHLLAALLPTQEEPTNG